MREFVAVIISFLIIPILSKKRVPIGIAICICALLMALLSGLGLSGLFAVVLDTFGNFTKIQQLIVIMEIGVLGRLLKQYKIIDKVIESLSGLVRSKRVTLMFIPALVGFLSVPGGAIISAPFVDRLGAEADLTKATRGIINLVYRHIAMHIMPYSTGFLLVASLAPQVSIYKLIGLNSIFVVFYIISGYFFYVREVKNEKGSPPTDILHNAINLLKYTAPVYVSVLLNLIFGIPFYIGMLANLIIVYFLHPDKNFLSDAVRSININVLYSLIGVYLIQGIISHMESFTAFFTLVFSDPKTILLGILASSFFLGLTTGFNGTSLGVVLPLLVNLPISENRLLLYTHMTFICGFLGYFFSPLHLCQLFTCEYLKLSLQELYKAYYRFFLCLISIVILNYFLLGMWLK